MIVFYSYWNEYFGYKFSISPESVSSAPQWQPYEDHPPLSPRLAIANSSAVVQRLVLEVMPFEPQFSACALKSAAPHADGLWYYVVSWFVPDLEDAAADWTEFSVPVLFDGSTPEPIKFKFVDRFSTYRRAD